MRDHRGKRQRASRAVASLDGEVVAVIATEVRDERLTDIWMMVNPDKLRAWERHN